MRDGVRLAADVHLPPGPGPWPVLLIRTPYDRAGPVTLVMFEPVRALERGYAVVIQDSRGRFGSEGVFRPFRPDIEDGWDTLDWLAGMDFCDGSVVMAGSSYVGATAWLAALSGHPALKAIAPAMTGSDYFEGWTHQGGAFQLAFNLFWALVHLAPEERRRRGLDPGGKTPIYARATDADPAEAGGWPGAQGSPEEAGPWLRRRPLADVPPLHGIGDFYFDWLAAGDAGHPLWTSTSPERNAFRVRCPVLAVTGWYQLFLRGGIEGVAAVRAAGATEAARQGSALVIGPWQNSIPGPGNTAAGVVDFGAVAGIDFEGLQLDFFDAALGRTRAPIPAVRYFQMGSGTWREAPTWPPPGTSTRALFLQSWGALGWAPPADQEAFDETRFDPQRPAPTLGGGTVPGLAQGPRDHRSLVGRPDTLAYFGEPLPEPLDLTGPVSAVVHLTTEAESVDVVAILVREDEEGRLLGICDGIARAGGGPGELAVTVDMLATSLQVPAGERLGLLLGHANFPRFDVNPGRMGPAPLATETVTSTQRIHRDARRPSRVLLPGPWLEG